MCEFAGCKSAVRDAITCRQLSGWRRARCIIINLSLMAVGVVAALICVDVVVSVFAGTAHSQSPGASSLDAGSGFKDIWELAKGAGPFGTVLMAYVWLRSDNERRKLQGERDALLERVLNANATHLTEISGIRQLLQTAVTGRAGG